MALSKKDLLLKEKLEYHYSYFDFSKLSPDPLEFPHKFKANPDIEISSFISSLFAYGNVTQIRNSLEKIHSLMLNQPFNFIQNYPSVNGTDIFTGLNHRFYSSRDIETLFGVLHKIYSEFGSLKSFFLEGYSSNEENLKLSISSFSKRFLKMNPLGRYITNGFKFMIPDPLKGSACKRMNLFLRWMVRKDDLDFGLWNEIPSSKLIIPVDTHVARICRQLRMTSRKNVSWNMASEITDILKKFDPNDPVKYDFAICHIGMRKLKF